MDIPEFDMKVLSVICSCSDGVMRDNLQAKFGKDVLIVLNSLKEKELIKLHEKDLKPFMPSDTVYTDPPIGSILSTPLGRIEVKRWETKRMLTNREKWLERIIGFVSGVLITVVSGLLLKALV